MTDDRTKIEYDASLIFRMREIGPDEMDDATAKYLKAAAPMSVVSHHEVGLFDAYVIHSGPTSLYEIARLGFWFICTCRDFTYSHTGCKHLYLVYPKVCRVCLATAVSQHGLTCDGCIKELKNEEMDAAPYLKLSTQRPVERIGSIRI